MIEAALVMPMAVVLFLAILQLALLEHARLFTEYAAFQAVRAGVVWGGNLERMQDAALVALLPTLGRTDDLASMALTYGKASATQAAVAKLAWPTSVPREWNGVPLRGLVRVDPVRPRATSELAQVWKLQGGARWKEIDFDGVDAFPQHRDDTAHEQHLERPTDDDADEASLRAATRLTIRLRYLYELKIPVANSFLFVAWYAVNSGRALFGSLERPNTRPQNVTGSGDVSGLPGGEKGVTRRNGWAVLEPEEMGVLWALSQGTLGLAAPGPARRYFMPLSATHTMRMQSNVQRKWLVHDTPTRGNAP